MAVPNILYPVRKFGAPEELLPITSDNYTDVEIDNLYGIFSCCYSQRVNAIVQNSKKGVECKLDQQTMYLLMALYILRNWYNESIKFSFPLQFPLGTCVVSLLLVSDNGVENLDNPVFENAEGTTPAEVLSSIQSLLPSNYSASLVNNQTAITIIVTSPYPTLNWYWVAQSSLMIGGYNLWFQTDVFIPCIPYSSIQIIIQNCLKICGCTNCKTLSAIESDNVYTSLGQTVPIPISGVTNYQDTIYFN